MVRTMFIAGNWKMNLNRSQAIQLAREIASIEVGSVDVAIFPPSIWLADAAREVADSKVAIGAQNCWNTQKGAFTGELSPRMIAEIATHVLLGHSERRIILGETNELVRSKMDAALDAGLDVILCVGEPREIRETGRAVAHVTNQLISALAGRSTSDLARTTIAYEPVWAIGTGVAATPVNAQEMSAAIRSFATALAPGFGEAVRILYGGSVNPGNARDLLVQPDIDGALVGGASLVAADFEAIIQSTA